MIDNLVPTCFQLFSPRYVLFLVRIVILEKRVLSIGVVNYYEKEIKSP